MKAIKPGVKIYGIRPEMVVVDTIVRLVFLKHGYDCITTSGVGKKHSQKSLHYVGYAEDYRAKHLPDHQKKMEVLADLKEALPNCDIVLEHVGRPQEHYHVEFDDHDDEQFQTDKVFYKTHGNWPHGH